MRTIVEVGDYQRESSPITELANAIIIQAVADYRKALKQIDKYANDVTASGKQRLRIATGVKRECERFFASRWCKELTAVNMKQVAQKIRDGSRERAYKTRRYAEAVKNKKDERLENEKHSVKTKGCRVD